MLIATATLISILLFGGPEEMFLMGTIEKGIKKEITDKDRQKEIKSIISDYKERVKNYKKIRKIQKKELAALYDSKKSSSDNFSSLYEEMILTLQDLQMETIDSRIQSIEMITDEEWKNMVKMEKDRLTKAETKASKSKKKDKEPKPFSNLQEVIQSLNLDAQNEQESLQQLEKVKKSYDDLVHTVQDSRNKFSQIIRDRNSTRTELESVANWNNQIKKDAYFNLVDLHKKLSENVTDENWAKVAKEFGKIIK
jgi:hypothetical protein